MFSIKNADATILQKIQDVNLFDYYRIVDVDTYLSYDCLEGKLVSSGKRCYEVWKRDGACKNCISRTTVHEHRRMIKLEYFEDQVYLIVSVPITMDHRRFSLELIGIVTESLVVNDSFHSQNLNAKEIIGQMNEIAIHDQYTGLYNKRYAELELSKTVIEWKKGEDLIIAVIDIDHFKHVNDTYGHIMGDEVLSELAKILSTYVKTEQGFVSRIGGDEFMILWKNVSLENARKTVEDFQKMIMAQRFIRNQMEFSISVSVGLSCYRKELIDWKEFVDEADQNMYLNKRKKYKR